MNYLTNSPFVISDNVKYHNNRITLSIDEILKNTKKSKIDTIVATLFKLNDEMEYRNFYIYLSGLKHTITSLLTVLPNVYFTLLIDISIISNEEILHKLKKIIQEHKYYKRIILLYYDSIKYRDKDNKNKMEGLIGTMVRFLFFFDYENNPFNIVMPCDIDYMDKYVVHFIVCYKLLLKGDIDYFFNCYDNLLLTNRIRHKNKLSKRYIYNKNVLYFNIANCEGCHTGIMKHQIIDNFIKDVMSKEYKYEKYCIIRKNARIKHFCYGVDEVFLNKIFIPKLYDNNKRIATLDIYNYMISSMVYYPTFSFNIMPKEYQLYILNNYNNDTIEDYYNPMNIKIYNLIIDYLTKLNKKYNIYKKINNTYIFNEKNYNKYYDKLDEEYDNKGLIVSDLLNVLKYDNIIMNKMIVIIQKGYEPDYNIIKSIYIRDNEFRTYTGDEFRLNNKIQKLDKDYQEIYKIIDNLEKIRKEVFKRTHDKNDKFNTLRILSNDDKIKYIKLIEKGETLKFKKKW